VKNTFQKKKKSKKTDISFTTSTDKTKRKQHKLCKLNLATFFKVFSKIKHSMDLERYNTYSRTMRTRFGKIDKKINQTKIQRLFLIKNDARFSVPDLSLKTIELIVDPSCGR